MNVNPKSNCCSPNENKPCPVVFKLEPVESHSNGSTSYLMFIL